MTTDKAPLADSELPKSLELHLQDIDADGWHWAVKQIRAHIAALEAERDMWIKENGITMDKLIKLTEKGAALEAREKRLRELLERACNGIEWRISTYPVQCDSSDYEMLDEIKTALAQTGEVK